MAKVRLWCVCTICSSVVKRHKYDSHLTRPPFFLFSRTELKLDSDTMVGPWTVRAELMEDGSSFQDTTQQPIDWLKKRAVTSMEQFMDGSVEYFVEIPHDHGLETMKTPLVFGPFDKNNRPEAWKNSDLRIQSTLPLVFVDTSSNSSRGRSESSSTSLVRVSLEVISKE